MSAHDEEDYEEVDDDGLEEVDVDGGADGAADLALSDPELPAAIPEAPAADPELTLSEPQLPVAAAIDGDGEDRRTSLRSPIELRVEYKRINTFFADYTKNISRGGTFISTDKPLPIDTEFVFALVVPHLAGPLRLRGKVMWMTSTEDASPGNPAGMGIEFQYESEDDRRDKQAAVERLLLDELGEHLATKLLGRKPVT